MVSIDNVYEAEGDARGQMQGTQTYIELADTSRPGKLDGAYYSGEVES